jgi:hypothetical protein
VVRADGGGHAVDRPDLFGYFFRAGTVGERSRHVLGRMAGMRPGVFIYACATID